MTNTTNLYQCRLCGQKFGVDASNDGCTVINPSVIHHCGRKDVPLADRLLERLNGAGPYRLVIRGECDFIGTVEIEG